MKILRFSCKNGTMIYPIAFAHSCPVQNSGTRHNDIVISYFYICLNVGKRLYCYILADFGGRIYIS